MTLNEQPPDHSLAVKRFGDSGQAQATLAFIQDKDVWSVRIDATDTAFGDTVRSAIEGV